VLTTVRLFERACKNVASNPAFLPEKIEEASMDVFQKFASDPASDIALRTAELHKLWLMFY
jgi:hypothetical protein